jgi:hypothetical protein
LPKAAESAGSWGHSPTRAAAEFNVHMSGAAQDGGPKANTHLDKYIICIMRILGCSLFDGLFLDWFQASATLGAHVLRGRGLGLSRGFAAFGGNSSL